MGLSAFTPKTDTVQFPGGEFAVRGLSLEDFTVLLRDYHKPLSALFDRYVAEAALEKADADAGGLLALGDMKGVVLDAVSLAPGLIGDCIARAAGEVENPHLTRTLPLGVQIDAITKVVTLTLEAEGGVEKLLETVSTLAASLPALAPNRSP